MSKITYLKRALVSLSDPDRMRCPNCGAEPGQIIDSKYFITKLRRCFNCQLQYRTPTDQPDLNSRYYDTEYAQGMTTNAPTEDKLRELKASGFKYTEKDFTYYIEVLLQLGLRPRDKLFDFGCSWGYGSYQFSVAGFDVQSFEIAENRRRYASEKLGVQVVADIDRYTEAQPQKYDCFFSSHVLEHVPSPARVFDIAHKLLRPGGLFVAFVPNGSQEHRNSSKTWSKLWGEVHPNFLDERFFDEKFSLAPRSIASSPVENAFLLDRVGLHRLNDLRGSELFFVARKTDTSWC